MKAIILAAGRGSRLGEQTRARPKCLVELGGQALLDRQLSALHAGGITEVIIVTGYCKELLQRAGCRTVHNQDWAHTNMVASLLCAADNVDEPVIVSYSDIVYSPAIIGRLAQAKGDIVIAYDPKWLRLWSLRFDDPLSDAESFRIDADSRVNEIGARSNDVRMIQGQYMGLLKLTPVALKRIRAAFVSAGNTGKRMDITTLLSLLINDGQAVYGVACSSGWCEIDSEHDLAVAEELLAQGKLEGHSTVSGVRAGRTG